MVIIPLQAPRLFAVRRRFDVEADTRWNQQGSEKGNEQHVMKLCPFRLRLGGSSLPLYGF